MTCFGDCFAQQRLAGEGGPDLGVKFAVFQIDQRSKSRNATTNNAQTRFDGRPNEKVIENI